MRKRQFTALGGWLLLFLLLCAVAVSGMAPQVWGGYLGDEFLIKRETGSRIENAVHS